MKKILFIILMVNFTLTLHAQQNIHDYVYFDTDQSQIKPEAETLLDKYLAILQNNNKLSIQLTGHTDDRGSYTYNIDLSKRRVNAIRDYFLTKGLDERRIRADFYGEMNPVRSNETASNRQSNRRVEILIDAPINTKPIVVIEKAKVVAEELADPIIEAATPEYTKTDLSAFKKAPDVFCIRNDRDTVLQGTSGTILFFKANSFDGRKITCDCIQIELTEFYTPKDVILNNLDTEAGNRLLETRGAINVVASCEEKRLKLKRGKKLDIHFPDVELAQGFQLFKGIEEGTKVNWARNARTYKSTFSNGSAWGRGGATCLQKCNYSFFIKRWICNWKERRRAKAERKELEEYVADLQAGNPNVDFTNLKKGLSLGQVMAMTSPKLGYINCDRFLSTPALQLADIYVKDKTGLSMTTSIVFKDINSVMSGRMNGGGEHWFERIPKNKLVWIIAIKKENDQYFLALEERNTNDKAITDLQFEKVSHEDLMASLEKVSW